MGTYYRLLHSPDHLASWGNAHYYSYHNAVPGEWSDLYYKCGIRDRSAYKLELYSGTHTNAALDAFLELARTYRADQLWARADLGRASQLDGTCAFSDMDSLHQYAQDTPYGGMYVVSFEGIYVSKIPESQLGSSGVLVKPTKTISVVEYQAR